MIPAFSYAISGNVEPSSASWSSPILVIPVQMIFSGARTLVASRRPPKPVSKTATSTPVLLNSFKAVQVSNSNSEQLMLYWALMLCTWASVAKNASLYTWRSFTCTESHRSSRWGELKRPFAIP
ncbi:hypothetical protein OGAPHI_005008 [Ogataea philodendri]|uniref:Uncharacterized protein n=1 Tax=Ogataea philodendri TaxID=1378263 RepID=A0A9P8P1T7_9ASCO|nr:uncharacterized protein OGAPHI_005008 [Ogataea philodendri]KAH3663607.1 hypothetical protein OGAPHI_005008 [Ogataea philodendri]